MFINIMVCDFCSYNDKLFLSLLSSGVCLLNHPLFTKRWPLQEDKITSCPQQPSPYKKVNLRRRKSNVLLPMTLSLNLHSHHVSNIFQNCIACANSSKKRNWTIFTTPPHPPPPAPLPRRLFPSTFTLVMWLISLSKLYSVCDNSSKKHKLNPYLPPPPAPPPRRLGGNPSCA